jgi:hypothetical protein
MFVFGCAATIFGLISNEAQHGEGLCLGRVEEEEEKELR